MINTDQHIQNLLLIQYPSGGYGYYLARLINSFVTMVVKTDDPFVFDHLGTSHSLPLIAGDIHHEKPWTITAVNKEYQPDNDQQKYIVVPYCPGIENSTVDNLQKNFSKSKVVRLYFDDTTWPLVFQNCIVKAKRGKLEDDVEFNKDAFGSDQNWARRENFILLLENHHFRNLWRLYQHPNFLNINILSLLTNPEQCVTQVANFIGGATTQLDLLPMRHKQFLAANPNTVQYLEMLDIVNALDCPRSLTYIDQLYHQAVLNFFIQH
jgi:hypothetical protein